MRYTFGTHLSKNGVPPRVAQAAMCHSSIDLSVNIYTDPELLDVERHWMRCGSLTLGKRRSISGRAQMERPLRRDRQAESRHQNRHLD